MDCSTNGVAKINVDAAVAKSLDTATTVALARGDGGIYS
jgi:hypothetical protein